MWLAPINFWTTFTIYRFTFLRTFSNGLNNLVRPSNHLISRIAPTPPVPAPVSKFNNVVSARYVIVCATNTSRASIYLSMVHNAWCIDIREEASLRFKSIPRVINNVNRKCVSNHATCTAPSLSPVHGDNALVSLTLLFDGFEIPRLTILNLFFQILQWAPFCVEQRHRLRVDVHCSGHVTGD